MEEQVVPLQPVGTSVEQISTLQPMGEPSVEQVDNDMKEYHSEGRPLKDTKIPTEATTFSFGHL